jgi:type I restriction enzyme, S subunit
MTGALKPYPKYKESGVEWLGRVPEGWEVGRLKYRIEVLKRIAGCEGLPVLSITQQGIKEKDLEANAGQFAADYSNYQLVYPGDFAANHMDLLTGFVGLSAVEGVTSPDYRVFRITKDDEIFDCYLLFIMQMGYRQRLFFPLGKGAAQLGRWRLPRIDFLDFAIPLPPLPEQQAIADYLDAETQRIDTLIAELREMIRLLKEKRQALISHCVTKGLDPTVPMKDSGVEWLGEVPEGWEVIELKRICSLIDGDRGAEYPNEDDIVESGIPFLSSTNVARGFLDLSEVKFISDEKFARLRSGKLHRGDIIITVRGSIGNTGIFDATVYRTGFINAQMMILRSSDNIEPRFLADCTAAIFWKEQLKVASYGTAQMQLSNAVLGRTWLPLPPLLEQQAIAAHLDRETAKIDRLISETEDTITLIQERRSALISSVVTGKLQVPGLPRPSGSTLNSRPENRS